MLKHLTRLFLFLCLMGSGFCEASVFPQDDRLYMDADAFKANEKGDEFYIHIGHNVWISTPTIHRDAKGMFALEASINRNFASPKMEYQKSWKCPYCYHYWPIGTPCQNKDCPSKYK